VEREKRSQGFYFLKGESDLYKYYNAKYLRSLRTCDLRDSTEIKKINPRRCPDDRRFLYVTKIVRRCRCSFRQIDGLSNVKTFRYHRELDLKNRVREVNGNYASDDALNNRRTLAKFDRLRDVVPWTLSVYGARRAKGCPTLYRTPC